LAQHREDAIADHPAGPSVPAPRDPRTALHPDRLLGQLTDRDSDPARVIERRETVALSFVVALQRLPASQRAALILRDVLA